MIESDVWRRIRKRLTVSARAFSTNARNRNLLRAQLSFGAAWTSEWALTVVLTVVAYRDGGAEAAGIVAFARMAPAGGPTQRIPASTTASAKSVFSARNP